MINSIQLPGETILEDLNRTYSFVGADSLRPTLNAVCFNFREEGMDVVATNGGVMIKISHDNIVAEKEMSFLLPPIPVAILRFFLNKMNCSATISFNDRTAVFVGENWKLTCLLIEGRYPNYNSVIPKNYSTEVLMEKKSCWILQLRMNTFIC